MKTFSPAKTYAIFANPAHRKLISELESSGSKVFQFTALKTEKIESETAAKIIGNVLEEYDWIIFEDVYSVDYFLEILEEQGTDFYELDALRVLAYGEAVADRLRFVRLHADIITKSRKTNKVFSTLISYIGESEIAKLNFFIPKALEYGSGLKDKLIESQARVTELSIYQMLTTDKKETAKIKALIKGGAIDEFIFTSPEDVLSLTGYAFPEILSEFLSETTASGTNETIRQTLSENDLNPTKLNNRIYQK